MEYLLDVLLLGFAQIYIEHPHEVIYNQAILTSISHGDFFSGSVRRPTNLYFLGERDGKLREELNMEKA